MSVASLTDVQNRDLMCSAPILSRENLSAVLSNRSRSLFSAVNSARAVSKQPCWFRKESIEKDAVVDRLRFEDVDEFVDSIGLATS